MSDERRQVLELLSSGKITAAEAERLIIALEGDRSSAANGENSKDYRAKPKYLRVVVEADEQESGHGPTKVNIRVPMQLLRAGVKLTSLIPQTAREHVNEALRENGVTIDIGQIRPENLEDLIENLNDLTVDVDDRHAKVRIFCE